MNTTKRRLVRTVPAALLLLAVLGVAHAQTGTITADPNAKPLQPIWQVAGDPAGGDGVGEGIGGLGDIYGTGKGAWGVYFGKLREWRIYHHDSDDIAKDTVPVRTFDSLSPALVVGDFWGTGHKAIGIQSGTRDTTGTRWKYYFELHVYRTDSNKIADTASVVLNTRTMTPQREAGVSEILAADLDGDHADELIIVNGGLLLDTGLSNHPELWIYKGGPSFQVDSPTVIVKHPIENGLGHVSAATGDFDGDGHVDIVISRGDPEGTNHLTFYWGTGIVAAFADSANRRIVELGTASPSGLRSGITALDCDGDSVMDIAIDQPPGTDEGVYLYRSGAGKSSRSRSYEITDADIPFRGFSRHRRGGYISDNGRRFEALMILSAQAMLFSGGSNGPDLAYDAYSTSNAFALVQPVLDVDGDGWDDILAANYTINFNSGVATIFAGGPYIPGPKVSGVDVVAGEGHERAVTVWPNPATDDLHIAWRGDLKRMPARFVVHDLLGNEVARGDVEPWRGAAVWHCADIPAGVYLLSISGVNGTRIATARIVKR